MHVKSPPRGFIAVLGSVGPGIIVLGSVIGSGELINTPVQAATYGFVLLWAVVLACLIKYFLQVEIGRHCLVHNRSTFDALNECPGPKWRNTSWIGIIYMVGYTVTLTSVIGMLTSVADLIQTALSGTALVHAPSARNAWGIATSLSVSLVLWSGAYSRLEKLVAALVTGFGATAVFASLMLQFTPDRITGQDILAGCTFSLGPHPASAAMAVISLMGALGTTANELFMYPYWILEKGYARSIGPPASEGWYERTQGWVRVLQVDAAVGTILATVVTAAFFLLGAAVFYRHEVIPQGMGVVTEVGHAFSQSFGGWSIGVFYAAAFCTLYSTLVVVIAATGRMWVDLLTSMSFLERTDERSRSRCQRICQMVYLVVVTGLMIGLQESPTRLVVFGQYVAGIFNTPLMVFAIIWLAFHTDRSFRMRPLSAVLLITTSLIIVGCILVSLVIQLGIWNQK